jgi:soluble lytic murein transglycosylase-like protein
MRIWKFPAVILTVAAAAWAPATASAAVEHVVAPGETLTSVAAADGLPIAQLAAANGISPESELVAGSLLAIPPQDAAAGEPAVSSAPSSSASPAAAPAVSSGGGGYEVQPGDTLSAIAARLGVTIDSLAAANGLDPSGLLLAGTTLHDVGVAAGGPATTQTVSTPAASGSGAQPTAERVSASEVGSIAAGEGVSPSLAEAIGYQESGFNNAEVSATGATGVMQIMPSTWSYIGQNLAGPPPLSPTSATDNIRAGSLLLHSLLDATGGDAATAVAGYYQGLQSVRQNGMFSDTQAYVDNVMALRQRFGGG